MPTSTATARLEARITPEQHALFKRAAELQGRTITDFVIAAVQRAAQDAVKEAEVLNLCLTDQEQFAQALLSSVETKPALERAFAHRSRLLKSE